MIKESTVKNVIDELKIGTNYEYFFNEINSPDWIDPLHREGFFKYPPEPVKSKVLYWPESKYLARVAEKSPEKVLQIILDVSSTENISVHHDFCEAAFLACPMEPNLAAEFAIKESVWLENQKNIFWSYLESCGNLIIALLKSEMMDAAYKLLNVLLLVDPKEEKYKVKDDDHTWKNVTHSPKVISEGWLYGKLLRKVLPQATENLKDDFLLLLIELLNNSLKFEHGGSRPEDYSYIWYQSLKDGPEYGKNEVLNYLISGIRDCAEQLINKKIAEVEQIVQLFEEYSWFIFQRLALHVLRRFPERNFELVTERLINRDIFDNHRLHHEYFHLIKENYAKLDEDAQNKILGWIEQGPDVERYKKYSWEEPTEKNVDRYVKIWKRDKLIPIKEFLPADWAQVYSNLVNEYSEPIYPDYLSKSEHSWGGFKSPKEPQELDSMSIPEIVEFLKEWKYSGNEFEESPEGMRIVLEELVFSKPDKFSASAAAFIGVDSTYIRGFVSGLERVVKNNMFKITWKPVLSLCLWAVDQPREIHGRNRHHSDFDPGWVWTRKRIANLLSDGLNNDASGLEEECRETVWQIIEVLLKDPEPTVEYEKDSTMDPATLSINTVRGQAFQAVMYYALWLRRRFEKRDNSEEVLEAGFNEMPEVKNALERHLDIDVEPSLTIRSLYGRFFPYFVLLDLNWAKQNISKIFPKEKNLEAYYNSAWESYMVFNKPYDNVFKLLRDHYFTALKEIDTIEYKGGLFRNPDECLVEHLIAFYLRGIIELDNELLVHFFDNSPLEFRKHALNFAGEQLYAMTRRREPESQNRLKRLWENRLQKVKELEDNSELVSFGYWFAPGGYDSKWEIQNLKEVLSTTKAVDNDCDVVRRLGDLAKEMPSETVECLDLIAHGHKDYWQLDDWRDSAKTILTAAHKSNDKSAKKIAGELANYFVTAGMLEFKDLLK